MIDAWTNGMVHGVQPCRIGGHFVMARRLASGQLVYGVWVVRTRARDRGGCAELLAEFRSKRFANQWAKDRNHREARA